MHPYMPKKKFKISNQYTLHIEAARWNMPDGAKFENKLKNMILNNSPKRTRSYAIGLSVRSCRSCPQSDWSGEKGKKSDYVQMWHIVRIIWSCEAWTFAKPSMFIDHTFHMMLKTRKQSLKISVHINHWDVDADADHVLQNICLVIWLRDTCLASS